jgi:hypothetical protein
VKLLLSLEFFDEQGRRKIAIGEQPGCLLCLVRAKFA